MKRSAQVLLVISGAILTGCSRQEPEWVSQGEGENQVLTNNTFVAGRGFYHAPYHAFFPVPYNAFSPGRGYFHGGRYTTEPDRSAVGASKPMAGKPQGVQRGGFARSSSRIGTVWS